ncbi:FAD binding domain-containing protein [Jimgerdemannia flammicorona]|uniref:FAD binding domain-containing protein n=1 Tax=Jimgerdemannia flammicorona TaxID=994334 RepID=A0A433Q6L1_9FUNG|nr:FAD binding domain-containing protein [Jimgerdemannia flammicorona]
MSPISTTDVLIIGGGSVGLFAAYNLVRQGVSVRIFDILTEPGPGRADAFHPRTVEILASLGVASELLQLGFRATDFTTYTNGVPASPVQIVPKDTSEFDFTLLVGQKHFERVLIEELAKHGVVVERPVTIESLEVAEEEGVTAKLRNLGTNEFELVKAKYAIGCDGAHSWVRKRLGISFVGETTSIAWGVFEGFIETNIGDPKIRFFNNEHGGTFFIPREQGMARVYVQISKEINSREERENMKLETILEQAAKNFQPFTFKAKEVTWWTSYLIGQHVADRFSYLDCVFLAGDACPTAGQGLNVGLNDAFNLAWKLSLTLKGVAQPNLLSTYQAERKSIAQQVIDIDRQISHYISRKTTLNDSEFNHKFLEVASKSNEFNNGLSIKYDPNLIVIRDTADSITSNSFEVKLAVLAGQRAPDGFMTKHGEMGTVRLIREMPLDGRFYVLVLAGNPGLIWSNLVAFDTYLAKGDSFWRRFGVSNSTVPPRLFSFLLICADIDGSQVNMLKSLRVAGSEQVYADDGNVHKKYGVDVAKGAIIVVRPDGWIGACIELQNFQALDEYFGRFLVDRSLSVFKCAASTLLGIVGHYHRPRGSLHA